MLEFRYLLYKKEELERKGSLPKELQQLFRKIRRHGICVKEFSGEGDVSKYIAEQEIHPEEALVIAAKDKTIEEVRNLPVATIGFLHEDFSEEGLYQADILVEGFEEVDYYFLERIYQRKHEIPWRVIETKRCYLREMTLEDLPDLYQLYEGEGMTKYMEPLHDWEQEVEYTKAYIANMYRYYGYGLWLIKDQETHALIGRAGLNHLEFEGEYLLEIGYAIDVSKQRMGYATEVCRAIIEYAKGAESGYEKLYAFVWEGNEASIALLNCLGFAFEKNCIRDGRKMYRYAISLI